MADKTAVEKFLERMAHRVCENDHPLPSGAKFCSECSKPEKATTLTIEARVTEIEAVLVQYLTVGATPDKSDDDAFWAKVRAGAKKLVTPTVESTPKKSK